MILILTTYSGWVQLRPYVTYLYEKILEIVKNLRGFGGLRQSHRLAQPVPDSHLVRQFL